MNFLLKIKRKIGYLCFYGRLSIHGLLGLPAQTSKERQLFTTIFNQRAGKRIRIFEWGSGLSTIYYARYLRARGVVFEWHAIDNNRLWYQRIKDRVKKLGLDGCIYLYLKEFLPFWEKPGWGLVPSACGAFSPQSENELAYINLPLTLGKKFDIIIIDARFRRHCLKVAKRVLATEGIVILHDAQKPHYHCGLEDFPRRSFYNTGSWHLPGALPNQIWVGSLEENNIFQALKEFK